MSDMDEKDRSRDRSRRERPSRFSEASRDRSNDRGRERGSMKSSNNRVYVSNIPYEYRWQDMKDLFRDQVGDVQFVELFVDDNDKPKGCGIVEFSDPASVKKCIEVMQRYEIKGRKLVIKEDVGNIRNKHGALMGGNKRPRENDRYRDDHRRDQLGGSGVSLRQDEGKWGNTYGLSPRFLESLNIDAPLCNKVFVANEENWDDDNYATYNPLNHVLNQEIIRTTPQKVTKIQKKKWKEKERKRLAQLREAYRGR